MSSYVIKNVFVQLRSKGAYSDSSICFFPAGRKIKNKVLGNGVIINFLLVRVRVEEGDNKLPKITECSVRRI